jgi:RNA polymerase sigma factor (sigma-70 family)
MDRSDPIDRLRHGDDDLLKEIYDIYQPAFIKWARRQGVQIQDAEEIFQQSVVILYENVKTGKLTNLTSTLKTYLFSIGKNKIQEFRRGRKHDWMNTDPVLLELLQHVDTDDGAALQHDIDRLVAALQRLGETCRALLDLMYFQKLTQKEIGERLQYKDRDTVKSKKYKCIAQLKKYLENPESPKTPEDDDYTDISRSY